MSAAFATAYRLTAEDWGSGSLAFTLRTLPNTQPPDCGVRLQVMPRHALVPFLFRDLSRFIIGTGKPGGQKLCQQASFIEHSFFSAPQRRTPCGNDPARACFPPAGGFS